MAFCKKCVKQLVGKKCSAAYQSAKSGGVLFSCLLDLVIILVVIAIVLIVSCFVVPGFSKASTKDKLTDVPRVLASFESAYLAAAAEGKKFTANDLLFQPPTDSKNFTYEVLTDNQGRPIACHAKSIAPVGKFSGTLITEYNKTDDSFSHRVEPASMQKIVEELIPYFIR